MERDNKNNRRNEKNACQNGHCNNNERVEFANELTPDNKRDNNRNNENKNNNK